MRIDLMRDRAGIPCRHLSLVRPGQNLLPVGSPLNRRVISAHVAVLAGDLHSGSSRSRHLARPVNLVQGVAIRATHTCTEMEIRSKPMLFGSIDPGRLSPIHKRRAKTAVRILFEEAHVVSANVVRVVAFQACGDTALPYQRVHAGSPVAAVGIGGVARGASSASMFAPTTGAPGVQMAPETGAAQKVVCHIRGAGRMGDLSQVFPVHGPVERNRRLLSAERESRMICHPWSKRHGRALDPSSLLGMALAAALVYVSEVTGIRDEIGVGGAFFVRGGITSMASGTRNRVGRVDRRVGFVADNAFPRLLARNQCWNFGGLAPPGRVEGFGCCLTCGRSGNRAGHVQSPLVISKRPES